MHLLSHPRDLNPEPSLYPDFVKIWSLGGGSNSRSAVYKTAALPLSYPGKFLYKIVDSRYCNQIQKIWTISEQKRCSAVELGWQNFKNIEDSRYPNKTGGFENVGVKQLLPMPYAANPKIILTKNANVGNFVDKMAFHRGKKFFMIKLIDLLSVYVEIHPSS